MEEFVFLEKISSHVLLIKLLEINWVSKDVDLFLIFLFDITVSFSHFSKFLFKECFFLFCLVDFNQKSELITFCYSRTNTWRTNPNQQKTHFIDKSLITSSCLLIIICKFIDVYESITLSYI